jgi:hypothetical protein
MKKLEPEMSQNRWIEQAIEGGVTVMRARLWKPALYHSRSHCHAFAEF